MYDHGMERAAVTVHSGEIRFGHWHFWMRYKFGSPLGEKGGELKWSFLKD